MFGSTADRLQALEDGRRLDLINQGAIENSITEICENIIDLSKHVNEGFDSFEQWSKDHLDSRSGIATVMISETYARMWALQTAISASHEHNNATDSIVEAAQKYFDFIFPKFTIQAAPGIDEPENDGTIGRGVFSDQPVFDELNKNGIV